ncbi:hypothetical protein BH09PLA1_BH09PLA1_06320 [soil metagenome]
MSIQDQSSQSLERRQGYLSRSECLLVLGLSFLFLVFGLLTATRYPPVWGDEVQDAERAINLVSGKGFTTAAHPYVSKDRFGVTTSPVYDLSLAVWLSIAKVGRLQIRLFNYVVIVLTVLSLWLGVFRLGIVRGKATRLMLAAMLLLAQPLANVYLNNRYDSTGILVLAAMFLAFSLKRRTPRLVLLTFLGLILGLCGFQFVPYCALPATAALLLLRRQVLPELIAISIGGIAGLVTLFGVLWYEAAIADCVHMVNTLRHTLSERLNVLRPFNLLRNDPATGVLALGMVLALISSTVRHNVRMRTTILLGLFFAVSVPVVMVLAGNYTFWYVWMAFVPTAMCAFSALDCMRDHFKISRILVPILAIVISARGLPAALGLALMEWRELDYARVEQFINQNVSPNDTAFIADACYYPVRSKAKQTYVVYYLPSMSAKEKQDVTVAVLSPCQTWSPKFSPEYLLPSLGGEWVRVADYSATRSRLRQSIWPFPKEKYVYCLAVYRRTAVRSPE